MSQSVSAQIQRLSSVRLENFRSFQGSHEVPLDADVVLIWGRNGTGKTTLLQSVEFALTGEVSDLARYVGDYPRCVVNAADSGPSRVTLAYRDSAGGERKITSEVDSDVRPIGLADAESRYFRERCYLSQQRLGRLLDSYAAEGQSAEMPLVRFVEEVLDLGDLAALIEGLHSAGDVRRLRTDAPQYLLLESRVKETEEALGLAREQATSAQTRLTGVVKGIQNALDARPKLNLGFAVDDDPIAALSSLKADRLAEESSRLSDCLVQLEEDLATARVAEKGLASGLEVNRLLAEAAAEFEEASASRRAAEEALVNVAESAKRALHEGGLDASGMDALGSPVAAIEIAKSRLADRIALTKGRRDEIRRLEASLNDLEATRQATAESLVAVSAAEGTADREDRLLEVLQRAIECTTDETCPVCDRDFSETGQGHLRDHLAGRLDALLAAREALQEQRERWLAGQAKLARIDSEMRSATDRLDVLREQTEELDQKDELTRAGLAKLLASDADLVDASAELARTLEAENRLAALRERTRQLDDALDRLNALAGKHSIQTDDRLPHDAAVHVLDRMRDGVEGLKLDLEKTREVIRLVEDGFVEVRGIDRARKKLVELEHQQERQLDAVTNAKGLQSRAKRIADEAEAVRAQLLDSVFSDTLNSLWDGLFARLAPRETFHPAFAAPEIVRKKLRLGMETSTDSGSFCGPGSVLSAGNVNTAALTMFLALNLVQQARMPILVLDDPVQSMDDVHLVNLAAMLRSLQRDVGRQLVVAVHERALFDYLALELTPQDGLHTLLGIELSEDPFERVTVRRYRWEDDSIRFATSEPAVMQSR